MVCVQCGSKTQIINSRLQRRLNQTWRRHRCLNCGAIFTTEEHVHYQTVWMVKGQHSSLKPFSRDKLLLSLYKSLEHRPAALQDAAGLTDTIMHKLRPAVVDGAISSATIKQAVQIALNRFDKAASVHYAAFHQNN